MTTHQIRKGWPYVPGLTAYGVIYLIGSVGVVLGLHTRRR